MADTKRAEKREGTPLLADVYPRKTYDPAAGVLSQLEYVYPQRPELDTLKPFEFSSLGISVSVQCGRGCRSRFMDTSHKKPIVTSYPIWNQKVHATALHGGSAYNRDALPLRNAIAFEVKIYSNADPLGHLSLAQLFPVECATSSSGPQPAANKDAGLIADAAKDWDSVGSFIPLETLEIILKRLHHASTH